MHLPGHGAAGTPHGEGASRPGSVSRPGRTPRSVPRGGGSARGIGAAPVEGSRCRVSGHPRFDACSSPTAASSSPTATLSSPTAALFCQPPVKNKKRWGEQSLDLERLVCYLSGQTWHGRLLQSWGLAWPRDSDRPRCVGREQWWRAQNGITVVEGTEWNTDPGKCKQRLRPQAQLLLFFINLQPLIK